MPDTIRAKIDSELTRRIGTWFTVRDIQVRLRINPSTLKPLIMKYARENVLKRRHIKGTARSVEFSPATSSISAFRDMHLDAMPYRSPTTLRAAMREMANMKQSPKRGAKGVASKRARKRRGR